MYNLVWFELREYNDKSVNCYLLRQFDMVDIHNYFMVENIMKFGCLLRWVEKLAPGVWCSYLVVLFTGLLMLKTGSSVNLRE